MSHCKPLSSSDRTGFFRWPSGFDLRYSEHRLQRDVVWYTFLQDARWWKFIHRDRVQQLKWSQNWEETASEFWFLCIGFVALGLHHTVCVCAFRITWTTDKSVTVMSTWWWYMCHVFLLIISVLHCSEAPILARGPTLSVVPTPPRSGLRLRYHTWTVLARARKREGTDNHRFIPTKGSIRIRKNNWGTGWFISVRYRR